MNKVDNSQIQLSVEVFMKWYEIPKINVQKLYDKDNNVQGVLLKAKDFEKLIEKMEIFLDIKAIEKAKKVSGRLYSHEEIKHMIEGKKQ